LTRWFALSLLCYSFNSFFSSQISERTVNGTGVFHITPDINTNSGDYTIYLTATENRIVPLGAENSTTTNFLLTLNAPNDRPKFSYQGDIIAIPGVEIAIPIYVVDQNQDTLTYSISGLPSGAVITPTATYGKAILTWTPTQADPKSANGSEIRSQNWTIYLDTNSRTIW
jgi:hypothetical protein